MSPGTIHLVDDEPGMLRALTRLLGAEGYAVKSYRSAAEFLAAGRGGSPGCVILDIAMPGMDGMELQQRLVSRESMLPVIFLSGHGNIPMSVRAMKSGAVDFLTKPVQDTDLLAAVRAALKISAGRAAGRHATAGLRSRLATLTPREHEVLTHVITGKLNKQIAAVLGTGEQTIKIHRMRMMDKMGIKSVAELVRAAERLGVEAALD